MNFKHIIALLKLRFNLSKNQLAKSGKFNMILMWILTVMGLLTTLSMFFVALICGVIFLPLASPTTILFIWNIVAGLFIVVWAIGLMVELQQTELMSIEKMLHLPVSLKGAFFLNYTSSFFNSAMFLFLPTTVGLTIAMVISRGPKMLMAPLLLAAFLFFVTTLTFQFRGWLGQLMKNKRNRGTIIAVVTMFFLALTQIPNVITIRAERTSDQISAKEKLVHIQRKKQAVDELNQLVDDGTIDDDEKVARLEQFDTKIDEEKASRKKSRRNESTKMLADVAKAIDVAVPPGWLPYGIYSVDNGKFLPAVYCLLGLIGLGSVSLTLSYRSAIRAYTGVNTGGKRVKKPASRQKLLVSHQKLSGTFKNRNKLAGEIPFLSEHQSAVAVGTFRSLLRSPETKMALLVPIFLGVVYGSLLMGNDKFNLPAEFRPFAPAVIIFAVLLCFSQPIFNIFGTDRDGFRAFVLSPVERKDILIGKNVANLPFLLGMIGLLLVVYQFSTPMKLSHLLATLVQVPIATLLYCLIGNVLSIYFPYGISRNTMQPAKLKFTHLLVFFGVLLLQPLLYIPMLLLLGVESIVQLVFQVNIEPFYLIASLFEMVLVVWIYRFMIAHQGEWLFKRETKILETVAHVGE